MADFAEKLQKAASSGDISAVQKTAAENNMLVVDQNNIEPLLEEFETVIVDADELYVKEDPEATPYKSKYEARKLLDAVINKLEANKTILTLEGKKGVVKKELDWRRAALQTRIGTISWDVEEPHNAQTELEGAVELYFPGFREHVDQLSTEDSENAYATIDANLALLPSLVIPEPVSRVCCDAIKCVNMLGILWAGRDRVKRSFLYLHSAKVLYDSLADNRSLPKGVRREVESLYTHNLFYLAQAYGHIGKPDYACKYCHETLDRQYIAGVDGKSAMEWVKNGMGIADFHMAMGKLKQAAYSLLCAEDVLKKKVLPHLEVVEARTGSAAEWTSSIQEMEGDLYRRWLRFYVQNMKTSLDFKHEVVGDSLEGISGVSEKPNEISVAEAEETITVFEGMDINIIRSSNTGKSGSETAGNEDTFETAGNIIWTTEEATKAFKRGFAKAEEAKKIFVFDGFVTDHIRILQDQSKLYHYLSQYESEVKRKLAMQGRRIEMLKPLLSTLSRSAFDHIHKEVAYECAETYSALLELKMDKFRSKGMLDEALLKASELKKCNEYCVGILVMLSHLTGFYVSQMTQVEDVIKTDLNITTTKQLEHLVASFNTDPDESTISEEEVRLFLNAHFMSARALSKMFSKPITDMQNKAVPTMMALKKYQWLHKYAPELCFNKVVVINDVFKDELMLCGEMVELLPGKIDRMVFKGESMLLY